MTRYCIALCFIHVVALFTLLIRNTLLVSMDDQEQSLLRLFSIKYFYQSHRSMYELNNEMLDRCSLTLGHSDSMNNQLVE